MKSYNIGGVFSPKFNVGKHYIGTAMSLMKFVRWVSGWFVVEEACVMGVKLGIVGSDSGETPCCCCNCSGHWVKVTRWWRWQLQYNHGVVHEGHWPFWWLWIVTCQRIWYSCGSGAKMIGFVGDYGGMLRIWQFVMWFCLQFLFWFTVHLCKNVPLLGFIFGF